MKTKIIKFMDAPYGHKKKIQTIEKMIDKGWIVEKEEIIPSKLHPLKGVLLMIICPPLLWFGFIQGKIIVTFVKD